jgi:hypothetical protein
VSKHATIREISGIVLIATTTAFLAYNKGKQNGYKEAIRFQTDALRDALTELNKNK